jgi:hypothetical protein
MLLPKCQDTKELNSYFSVHMLRGAKKGRKKSQLTQATNWINMIASRYDPVRMNAWRRDCAAWVSSGVPDMTTILSVDPE